MLMIQKRPKTPIFQYFRPLFLSDGILRKHACLCVYFLLQELARDAILAFDDILWCSCENDITTTMSAIRTDVYNVICTLYYIEVVLDYQYCVSSQNQCFERTQQTSDVMEMQTCRWLIKDKDGWLLLLLSDEICQLNTLVFAS